MLTVKPFKTSSLLMAQSLIPVMFLNQTYQLLVLVTQLGWPEIIFLCFCLKERNPEVVNKLIKDLPRLSPKTVWLNFPITLTLNKSAIFWSISVWELFEYEEGKFVFEHSEDSWLECLKTVFSHFKFDEVCCSVLPLPLWNSTLWLKVSLSQLSFFFWFLICKYALYYSEQRL